MTPDAGRGGAPRLDDHIRAAVRGRRCLVTGGLGFIGSNLALTLVDLGAEVTVVDACMARHGANPHNLDRDHGSAPDGLVVIEADIADDEHPLLCRAVAEADVVFNLAGQVSHLDSMNDPLFDLQVNTTSHFTFLEFLRRENPDAVVVYTSTRQVFGKPHYLPVDENHPVSPVDVNGITKYATEQLHLLYDEIYGLRSVVVRLTNVFGPRQRLRDDFQGFLPIFVRRALRDETISVFGDGSQQRDCLHVDDVVECLLLAAVTSDASGEVYNIGNEERLTLRFIAEAVVRAAGSGRVEFTPWPADRDAIDIGSYFGDSSKAKRMLGWEPRTGFEDGIEQTIAFYRAHGEWYL
jgi:UDP-glucose 4-epimerase